MSWIIKLHISFIVVFKIFKNFTILFNISYFFGLHKYCPIIFLHWLINLVINIIRYSKYLISLNF